MKSFIVHHMSLCMMSDLSLHMFPKRPNSRPMQAQTWPPRHTSLYVLVPAKKKKIGSSSRRSSTIRVQGTLFQLSASRQNPPASFCGWVRENVRKSFVKNELQSCTDITGNPTCLVRYRNLSPKTAQRCWERTQGLKFLRQLTLALSDLPVAVESVDAESLWPWLPAWRLKNHLQHDHRASCFAGIQQFWLKRRWIHM